jgi:hypothetical protein
MAWPATCPAELSRLAKQPIALELAGFERLPRFAPHTRTSL